MNSLIESNLDEIFDVLKRREIIFFRFCLKGRQLEPALELSSVFKKSTHSGKDEDQDHVRIKLLLLKRAFVEEI